MSAAAAARAPGRTLPIYLGEPAAPQRVRITHAAVVLTEFADEVPASPTGDNATFWAMCVRQDLAILHAQCTLERQLQASSAPAGLPTALGRALTAAQTLMREKIKASIHEHVIAGGTDGAQLLVDLNATRGAV